MVLFEIICHMKENWLKNKLVLAKIQQKSQKQVVNLVAGCVALAIGLSACQKVEDPFVERVVAPVLVLVENTSGDGGGLTGEPVVPQKVSGSVTMSVRIVELNKAGLLDNKVGIDSIPVTGLALKLTLRNGTAVGDLTTDGKGRATITKAWADLGVATPKSGNTVLLTWTGAHKSQAFSRLSRVQGIN